MGHARGGGIGNMAGIHDHTGAKVIEELRQRILTGVHGDITEDELDRLIGKTQLPAAAARRWTTRPCLGIAEVATAALDEIKGQEHRFDLRR